ncbi:MAG: hypothetical protein M3R11_05585 [Acidobacteriota bacterium]|nr:hypothetical protein [Acidobacteriota bacterium]
MKRTISVWLSVVALSAATLSAFQNQTFAQTKKLDDKNVSPISISTAALKAEGKDFTAREIAAHFGEIETLNPPPERVFGALTVGEFSWGSFMRALAAQAEIGANRTIAGKDTARAIGEMGLIEARSGGKAFAQLYAALALRHYGSDLSKNAVWQSLSEAERKEWNALLDPTRIYDVKTRNVINLPENYLGVAARIAAMSFEMNVLKDRAFLDSIIDRAAVQFTGGAIYADDNPPTGRYDRYSNEYARYCWEAAGIAGRKDIQEKLKPSLKIQMKLWWDLVSPEGYGYNWGRSQGLVSYLDTLEIAAFLGEHPEFRPVPLADIAALYNQAWRWIRADYSDQTHLFTVFKFGRGNYSYINPNREWQQTGTSFGKIILAHDTFIKALERENLTTIPAAPKLGNVARFEFFDKTNPRKEGVWLVRQGNLKFALPITVGTKPAIADYLPAPFGLAGFANPVEEVYPSLVPFLEMTDGKIYAASDGADEIEPGADGKSLKVVWRKWALVGSKSGEQFDNGITSEVEFRIENDRLIRRETLMSDRDLTVKKWRVAVPVTAAKTYFEMKNGQRVDFFSGREGTLAVSVKSVWKMNREIIATGNSRLGKGVLGAIPLHLIYESSDLQLKKNQKLSWEITLELMN